MRVPTSSSHRPRIDFALRAYNAGPGELGSEPTPALFLEALWAATREMVRVLKPSGSIMVNLGDSYSSRTGAGPNAVRGGRNVLPSPNPASIGVREKSLLGLPWAYALGATGMLAALGGPDPALNLILRAEVCWSKPNGLPESVTDRVRRSHESWFHFTRSPRYYAAVDEVREPHAEHTLRYEGEGYANNWATGVGATGHIKAGIRSSHPLGKLPGSVWSIPSEPLRLPDHLGVQHYAAFPSEWPRRLILGWSPPGICVECDQGRVPVVDRELLHVNDTSMANAKQADGQARAMTNVKQVARERATILGYACACTPYTDHPERRRLAGGDWIPEGNPEDVNRAGPGSGARRAAERAAARAEIGPVREYHLDGWRPPPTRPALVLDPFGGTGTTAMVARALGRHAVSVDLSHAYSRAARWRVTSDNAAKAISRTNAERQGSLL